MRDELRRRGDHGDAAGRVLLTSGPDVVAADGSFDLPAAATAWLIA